MSNEAWSRLYSPRLDEVRATLNWSLEVRGRRHIGIAQFGVCARLFDESSLISEGRSYAERLLPLLDDDVSHASSARLLRASGILWRAADRLRAVDLFQRSAGFYRKLPDRLLLGDVLALIGGTNLYLGHHETAQKALEEAVAILSADSPSKALWNALNDLGAVHAVTNRPKDATRYYNQAREIAQSLKDTLRENLVLVNLAELEFCHGAPDRALFRLREAQTGLAPAPIAYRAQPVVNLSTYQALLGDFDEARRNATLGLALAREAGGYSLRLCLQVWALIATREGRHVSAARLIGFIDQAFARSGEARQKPEQQLYDLVMRLLGENMSQDSIRVWGKEGGYWSEAEAIEVAEAVDTRLAIH